MCVCDYTIYIYIYCIVLYCPVLFLVVWQFDRSWTGLQLQRHGQLQRTRKLPCRLTTEAHEVHEVLPWRRLFALNFTKLYGKRLCFEKRLCYRVCNLRKVVPYPHGTCEILTQDRAILWSRTRRPDTSGHLLTFEVPWSSLTFLEVPNLLLAVTIRSLQLGLLPGIKSNNISPRL